MNLPPNILHNSFWFFIKHRVFASWQKPSSSLPEIKLTQIFYPVKRELTARSEKFVPIWKEIVLLGVFCMFWMILCSVLTQARKELLGQRSHPQLESSEAMHPSPSICPEVPGDREQNHTSVSQDVLSWLNWRTLLRQKHATWSKWSCWPLLFFNALNYV